MEKIDQVERMVNKEDGKKVSLKEQKKLEPRITNIFSYSYS